MSDWQNYLDLTRGEPIHLGFCVPDEPLHESRLLRPGARELILSQADAASRFLDLVAGGQMDFSSQQRLISLLLDIHLQVHKNPMPKKKDWLALKPQLTRTMAVLGEQVGDFLLAEGADLELDEDDLSHTYGFGQGVGCIQYGLPIARRVALRAFIEAFCRRYAQASDTDDLVGSWSLKITVPQAPEFAKVFAGVYGEAAHARITQAPGADIWHLEFLNFPPIKPWYALEGAAYKAAAPVVAQVLAATVVAVGEMSD